MIENQNRKSAESNSETELKRFEKQAIDALETALTQIRTLSDQRLKAKLSVSRVAGVARELRELIKVLSIYGC